MHRQLLFQILLVISLGLSFCSNNKERMVKSLTNNNYKYWYRYHKDTSRPYPLGFCVLKNGTFIEYYNKDWDRSIRVAYNSPVLSDPIWEIIDDSTMIFGKADTFKILTLNSDSIILKSLPPDTNFLKLKRDIDQITKPK